MTGEMYRKPVASGGVSRCRHCGKDKVRVTPPKRDGGNLYPRTVRSGCPNGGEHLYETELVAHGWTGAR